jgi:hypothetical protein
MQELEAIKSTQKSMEDSWIFKCDQLKAELNHIKTA